MKGMFTNWEWGDTGLAMFIVGIACAAALSVFALTQEHDIRYYYLSNHGTSSGNSGYCINGYRDWCPNDTGVFCSDEIQKSLAVLKELNAGLAARK